MKRKLLTFTSVFCISSMILCTTAFAKTTFSYGVSVEGGVLSGGTGSSSYVGGNKNSDVNIDGTGVTAAGKNVNLKATISDESSGTSVSVDVNVKNGALAAGTGNLDTSRINWNSGSDSYSEINKGAGVVGSGKEVTLNTSITGAESNSKLNVKVKDGSLSAGAGKSLYADQYSWYSGSDSRVQLKEGAGVVSAGSEVKLTTNLPGTPSDTKDKVIVENGALGAGVGTLKAEKYDDYYNLNSRTKVIGIGVVTAGDYIFLYPNVPGIPFRNYISVVDGVLGAGSGMQHAKKIGSGSSNNYGDGFVTAGESSTINPYPPVFATLN